MLSCACDFDVVELKLYCCRQFVVVDDGGGGRGGGGRGRGGGIRGRRCGGGRGFDKLRLRSGQCRWESFIAS